jgi:cytochrome d ubiquinol oxidase subunit I
VSALQLLRSHDYQPARRMLKLGVAIGAVLAPLQILVGDMHGLNTLEHQPAKIAAIEGIWRTERGVPLLLFAVPNAAEQRNDYALSIPKGASLILRHDPDAQLRGLNEFQGKHPPVAPLFYGFRIMVGLGVLMLALSWWAAFRLWRRASLPHWTLVALACTTFIGWVAVLAGWIVTEVGRQPYLIYNLLTVVEAASAVPAGKIGLSLLGYAAVYAALLIAYILVLTQMALKEPRDAGRPQEVPRAGGLLPT